MRMTFYDPWEGNDNKKKSHKLQPRFSHRYMDCMPQNCKPFRVREIQGQPQLRGIWDACQRHVLFWAESENEERKDGEGGGEEEYRAEGREGKRRGKTRPMKEI